MSWLYLAFAIVFEIAGTTAMKLSDGMTRLAPGLAVVVCYAGAFFLMSRSLRELEVGIVYAIWSGVGTAAIAVIGVLVFAESVSALKLLGIALIVAGVISLRLADVG